MSPSARFFCVFLVFYKAFKKQHSPLVRGSSPPGPTNQLNQWLRAINGEFSDCI
jgi:hypothetical protein